MRAGLKSALLLAMVFHASNADQALAITGPSETGAPFGDRIVMVLTRGGEGSGFCTGIVVAPSLVLTAAHCLHEARDTLVHFRDAEGRPVLIPVAAVAAHPDYRPDAVRKRIVSVDLGLIRTLDPLPASFHPAQLAKADSDGPALGEAVWIAGFGLAREGEPKTGGVLRAARLEVTAPLSQVLARETAEEGLGACSGDSGAPVFAADRETVVAIVAWTAGAAGRKCGRLSEGPRLAPLRGWIEETATQIAR